MKKGMKSNKMMMVLSTTIALVLMSSGVMADYVYQEDANATDISSPGIWIGGGDNTVDGDYGTYDSYDNTGMVAYNETALSVNYTFVEGSLWQVKDTNSVDNITLETCSNVDGFYNLGIWWFCQPTEEGCLSSDAYAYCVSNGSVYRLLTLEQADFYEEGIFYYTEPTTTTTTTISAMTQTLGDIGTGVGGLLDGIGSPLAVFVILISVASAIVLVFSSIGKGVGKKV